MYTTGTISSNTPAPDFIAYLGAQMLNVSWTQVSTNVVSGNNSWNVYKSPGLSNNIGNDFYAALGWDNATNTYIGVTVFEGWNATTNTANNYPAAMPYYTTNNIDGNNGGILLSTVQSGNNSLPNSANFASGTNLIDYGMSCTAMAQMPITSQGGISYWVSATVDRVIFQFANTSQPQYGSAMYVGSFDPTEPLSLDPYPICAMNLNSTSIGSGSDQNPYSVPGVTTRSNYFTQYGAQYGFSIGLNETQCIVNNLGTNTLNDPFLSGKTLISKIYVTMSNYYWKRGVLKDVYYCYCTAYRGDTIQWTIGGTTYNATCIDGQGSNIYKFFGQV